jgi:hypothetical protein
MVYDIEEFVRDQVKEMFFKHRCDLCEEQAPQ